MYLQVREEGLPSLTSSLKSLSVQPVSSSSTAIQLMSDGGLTHGNVGGVTLAQICDHLLLQIPGLREHGPGRTTVAYLMVPPRQKTHAALRYKGVVKARVPAKRNDFREHHVDSHYLLTRVAYRGEFAMHFKDECSILSCDHMNKLKVGTLTVSRYQQVTKFFPNDDQPNYPDHDFRNPGYKLITSGYMILTDYTEEDSKQV